MCEPSRVGDNPYHNINGKHRGDASVRSFVRTFISRESARRDGLVDPPAVVDERGFVTHPGGVIDV